MPNSEAMGYEALLQNYVVAKARRLIGQGRKTLLKVLKRYKTGFQVGTKDHSKIFGVNDSAINYAIRKDEDSDEYSTHMGEFCANTRYGAHMDTKMKITVAGNWRIKTVGSLADKLKGR